MTTTGRPLSWRFDAVLVEPAAFRLTVNGTPQSLEPKSFRLLVFLIEHRDRAVSKAEIFKTIWPDTFVSDNALTRVVAQLRRTIDDDPRQPRYIETVPTVGYRFIGHVEEVSAPESTATLEAPSSADGAPLAATPAPRRAAIVGVAAVAIAAAIGAWYVLARTPIPPTARNAAGFLPVQFTSSPGLDMNPSIAPDGNLVAYASDKSGGFEIYVKSADAGARELQLTNDGEQNMYPAFSPDGRWIAYTSTRRRGIFRIPALGGSPQRLTTFGVQPVWSPDGKTIVFRSSAASSLSTTDYYWPAESNLWIVSANGGDPVRITGENGQLSGGQSFPSFSVDGSEIRFLNHFQDEASIWAYTIADRSVRKLFGSTKYPFSNATFAPDGTRMWFVNWLLNGNIGIWQVALDPRTLTPVGEPEALYPTPFAVPRDLALSADGKRLAFTAVMSKSAILMRSVATDGDAARSLTDETVYRYALPRTSPDGTRIVFAAFPRNANAGLRIVRADAAEAIPIDIPDASINYGGLSSDNRHLFLAAIQPRQIRIMSRDLSDGGSREVAVLPRGTSQVVFSSDGGRALYHSDYENRRRVYLFEAATGTSRVIASGTEDMGFPRFSRDDKWISIEMTHRSTGGDDILVMPASGGATETILAAGAPTFAAGWMPDNDRILFAGFREGAWNIFTVSRTTRATKQLTTYTSPRIYVRYPDWVVGDRIVYEFNETTGNIFVATLK